METGLAAFDFFDLNGFDHGDLFEDTEFVWEALDRLPGYLDERIESNTAGVPLAVPLSQTLVLWGGLVLREGFRIIGGSADKGEFRVVVDGEETTGAVVLYAGCVLMDDRIQLGPGCVLEPGALIKGPTLIAGDSDVRQGAYVRGKCLIGRGCVVGHTTEMKASVMLNGAKAGHFAYLGDSILGNNVNLGAGTKLANLNFAGRQVQIRVGDRILKTGRRKLGAILGDGVETGCNVVTNPGTLLGKGCMAAPTTSVAAGYHKPRSIVRPTVKGKS